MRSQLKPHQLLRALTATLVVAGFVLVWGVVWIWSSDTESLSWVVWTSTLAPVVFWAAYEGTVARASRRPLVATMLLALAVALWIWGGVTLWVEGGIRHWEWGPYGVQGVVFNLLLAMLSALIATPAAFGAAVRHPRLSTALAAVLLGQALVVVLIILLPAPEITKVWSSTHTFVVDEYISTRDRILIVGVGGAGTISLMALGAALRRYVPIRITWPAALGFFLAAAIYQDWYPSMSTLGN